MFVFRPLCMAHSFVMAGENAPCGGQPTRCVHQAARQTRPLAGGRFAPTTNFLYVLWEIKAPEEMLTILWS